MYNKKKHTKINTKQHTKHHTKQHTKHHTKQHTKQNTKTISNNVKHISILSYNISWESMSGSVKSWALCSNNTDITNSKHNSICISNIAKVINENKTDFITLQEATEYKKLFIECPRLSKMTYETHKSGLDVIATFWNNKYKYIKKITGEFENGRPWMAIIFSNGICLINVHLGHYNHNEVYQKLHNLIHTIKNTYNTDTILIKRYIISGDFNYDIKKLWEGSIFTFTHKPNPTNTLKLDNTIFYYHPKNILTCCVNRSKHFDHVIDTKGKPHNIYIPNVEYMASDHKPIIAELSL